MFQGKDADKKKKPDSWQYQLLEYPNDEVSRFSFFADVVSGLESCGNAFIFKSRMPRARRLGALSVLHPANMTIRRDQNTNELIYEWWNGRESKRIPNANLLHIRGDTMGGGDVGYSPIQVHRHAMTTQLQREQFESKHFQNDARPGVALIFPMGVTSRPGGRVGESVGRPPRRPLQPRPHRSARWWREHQDVPDQPRGSAVGRVAAVQRA